MNLEDLTIDFEQHAEITGAIGDVFERVLYRFGEGETRMDGKMILEPFAGGRWYRDRGDGIQHLWGHVQVIKPPVLLEISGPMFMSYPAINHVEVKLEEIEGGTNVTVRHRAIGMIPQDHREGMPEGTREFLEELKNDFSKAAAGKPA